jgi:hypothetical protein
MKPKVIVITVAVIAGLGVIGMLMPKPDKSTQGAGSAPTPADSGSPASQAADLSTKKGIQNAIDAVNARIAKAEKAVEVSYNAILGDAKINALNDLGYLTAALDAIVNNPNEPTMGIGQANALIDDHPKLWKYKKQLPGLLHLSKQLSDASAPLAELNGRMHQWRMANDAPYADNHRRLVAEQKAKDERKAAEAKAEADRVKAAEEELRRMGFK